MKSLLVALKMFVTIPFGCRRLADPTDGAPGLEQASGAAVSP